MFEDNVRHVWHVPMSLILFRACVDVGTHSFVWFYKIFCAVKGWRLWSRARRLRCLKSFLHIPVKGLTFQSIPEMKTNRQITRADRSCLRSCSVVKVLNWKLNELAVLSILTSIVVHPGMYKSIIVFDKYIISTFWTKIIRVIITEYVANLELYNLTWTKGTLTYSRTR